MPHSERSVLGEGQTEHSDANARKDRRDREEMLVLLDDRRAHSVVDVLDDRWEWEERLDVPEDQREMVRRRLEFEESRVCFVFRDVDVSAKDGADGPSKPYRAETDGWASVQAAVDLKDRGF